MKYSFHPSAKIELSEAVYYYETRKPDYWKNKII